MTARERHSLTEAAIDSIVADTAGPYRFVYIDAQSPPWLRDTLAARAGEWNLEVVRFDEPLSAQEARRRIAPSIATDYAVFIDNDIQVEEGWLDALIACADETGAGIVGSLYLWGDGISPPKIHMAGGRLLETAAGGGRVLEEFHELLNADPRAVPRELVRRSCDFVEFHCMLIRTALLRDPAFFDPQICCVHEHIDVALQARRNGYRVYFEPASRVHYMAFADYMLDDLEFFKARWSKSEGESSIEAFCRKWNVVNDDRSFGDIRQYLRTHVAQIDPLRADTAITADRRQPMQASELVQSRSALLDAAAQRGYPQKDLDRIAAAYRLAQRLFDGIYRPCGRPFVNHAVGVAGVLVRYGFAVRNVVAALLHSAYTHSASDAQSIADALNGLGGDLERRVRAYTERDRDPAANEDSFEADALFTLSVFEAETLALVAANEIDMHLSGEFRYSGRSDAISEAAMVRIEHVCRTIGADGLYVTLQQARAARAAVADGLQTHLSGSYRISPAANDRPAVQAGTGARSSTPH